MRSFAPLFCSLQPFCCPLYYCNAFSAFYRLPAFPPRRHSDRTPAPTRSNAPPKPSILSLIVTRRSRSLTNTACDRSRQMHPAPQPMFDKPTATETSSPSHHRPSVAIPRTILAKAPCTPPCPKAPPNKPSATEAAASKPTGHQSPCRKQSSTKHPKRRPTRKPPSNKLSSTESTRLRATRQYAMNNPRQNLPAVTTLPDNRRNRSRLFITAPHRVSTRRARHVTARQDKTKKEAAFGDLSALVLHTRIELVFAD